MEFSIKFDTFMSEWCIIYIEVSRVIVSTDIGFSFSKGRYSLKNSADLMKWRIVRHFIWVFTDCPGTCLDISGLQRVKIRRSDNLIQPLYLCG